MEHEHMIIRICNSTADINVFSLPLLCAPFNLKCALTAIESQPTMILAKLSGLQKIFAQLQAGPVSAYKKKLLFVKVSAVRQRERKQILTRQRHGVPCDGTRSGGIITHKLWTDIRRRASQFGFRPEARHI